MIRIEGTVKDPTTVLELILARGSNSITPHTQKGEVVRGRVGVCGRANQNLSPLCPISALSPLRFVSGVRCKHDTPTPSLPSFSHILLSLSHSLSSFATEVNGYKETRKEKRGKETKGKEIKRKGKETKWKTRARE